MTDLQALQVVMEISVMTPPLLLSKGESWGTTRSLESLNLEKYQIITAMGVDQIQDHETLIMGSMLTDKDILVMILRMRNMLETNLLIRDIGRGHPQDTQGTVIRLICECTLQWQDILLMGDTQVLDQGEMLLP